MSHSLGSLYFHSTSVSLAVSWGGIQAWVKTVFFKASCCREIPPALWDIPGWTITFTQIPRAVPSTYPTASFPVQTASPCAFFPLIFLQRVLGITFKLRILLESGKLHPHRIKGMSLDQVFTRMVQRAQWLVLCFVLVRNQRFGGGSHHLLRTTPRLSYPISITNIQKGDTDIFCHMHIPQCAQDWGHIFNGFK